MLLFPLPYPMFLGMLSMFSAFLSLVCVDLRLLSWLGSIYFQKCDARFYLKGKSPGNYIKREKAWCQRGRREGREGLWSQDQLPTVSPVELSDLTPLWLSPIAPATSPLSSSVDPHSQVLALLPYLNFHQLGLPSSIILRLSSQKDQYPQTRTMTVPQVGPLVRIVHRR